MEFVLNKRKAAQAAAFLLQLNGGKMNLLLLMKLIYLADRMALSKSGFTITGGRMVSMQFGPIISEVFDYTKPDFPLEPSWREYISERADNTLSCIKKNPENDELSKFELRILEEIYQEHGYKSPSRVVDETHKLPEYRNPGLGSLPIDPTIILRQSGMTEEEISEIVQLHQEISFLKSASE